RNKFGTFNKTSHLIAERGLLRCIVPEPKDRLVSLHMRLMERDFSCAEITALQFIRLAYVVSLCPSRHSNACERKHRLSSWARLAGLVQKQQALLAGLLKRIPRSDFEPSARLDTTIRPLKRSLFLL